MTTSTTTSKTDYVAVLIAYLSFVVLGLPSAMLGIAWASDKWPSIQKTFNLGLDAVGALFVAFTIGYSLVSFMGGRLFGRFNSSTLFFVGSLISAAALAGYGILPAWGMIVACGFLLGFGSGILDAGMNIYFAAVFNARLMNWLHACFGIGTVIGPLLMTVILSRVGGTWQIGYFIGAGAYLLVGLFFLLTRSRWANVGRGTLEEGTHLGISARSTLRLPLVWVSLGIFLAYTGLEGVGLQWTFPLFNKVRGIDAITAGTWLVYLQASFTIGRIFFGFALGYFKPRTIIRVCAAALIIVTFLLIINPMPNAAFILLAVYGFTLAPIWALTVINVQEQLGPVHGANAIGFLVAAAGIGAGVLPGIAGVLANRSSLEAIPVILFVLSVVMTVLYEYTIIRSMRGVIKV
ncbi:MAG: MFS transporter [Candidatus Bathyarchaeota archaeon]|nr:MFS transporter [Candidatus Bathyarchaeota archaeon]